MASWSFSLPPLKVTRHAKGGSKAVTFLQSSFPKPLSSEPLSQEPLTARAHPEEILTTGFELCDASVEEPTAYELEMKASVRSWEQIREPIMRAVIEGVGRCVFLLSFFFQSVGLKY